jgi:hypothetical protein
LVCTTILGGKTARSHAPWTILKTGQALFKKPLSPFTDNLFWHIDSTGDLFVFKTFEPSVFPVRPSAFDLQNRKHW